MASTTVTFDIVGRDRSGSAAFNKVGDSANRADGAMSKFSAGATKVAKAGMFALGAGAVVAAKGLYEMAQSAAEDELAQKKLALGLKNATGATDAQVASVERWITAQGKALGVADDDLRPALQRLASATKDVGEAQDLASLAMDVSAGSGKSLEAVSTALMKAANGQVSSLSRLGINVKNAKDETVSFEEAQRRMAETFGGQAAKAAETTAGKFARLKLILAETGEEIGAKLIPYASDLADAFVDKGVPALEDFADKAGPVFRNMVDGAGDIKDAVAPAVEEIAEALGNLATEGEGAGQVFDDVFLPALRGTADVVAGLVDFIDDLPGPIKNMGVQAAIAAIALYKVNSAMIAVKESGFVTSMSDATSRTDAFKSAARSAAGVGGILALTQGMQQADDKTKALLTTAGGIATGFAVGGPVGAAIGGLTGLVIGLKDSFTGAKEKADLLADQQRNAAALEAYRQGIDDLSETMDRLTGAYTGATRAAALQTLKDEELVNNFSDLGLSVRTGIDAMLGNERAMRKIADADADLAEIIDYLSGRFRQQQRETRNTADAVESLAARLGVTGKALRDIPRDVRINIRDDVPDSLREIKNLGKEVGGLDKSTIRILLKAADLPATKKNIDAVRKSIEDTDDEEANPPIGVDDREFRKKNADILKDIRALDREFASPGSTLTLTEYYRKRAELMNSLRTIPDETVNIHVQRLQDAGGVNRASGGLVTGPGTSTSDSIPVNLSNREYVVKAAAVEKYGVAFLDRVNGMALPTGAPSRFVATQARVMGRASDSPLPPRRIIVEVRATVGGELDLTKAKAQINGMAREVFADEYQDQRTFERQQR